MSAQFRCGTPNRRLRILEPGAGGKLLQGIDYLEVLDHEATLLMSPPQRTLLVHLFRPAAGLAAANVALTGGVRTTNIGVQWAYPADAVPVGPNGGTSIEVDYFSHLADAKKVLVVRLDKFGDASTYTLAITGVNDLDPVLSRVDFSFKVECPSDFDCEQPVVCPPVAAPPPPIDYQARDYQTFKQVMLDRMSVIMPDWQERNAADLGVMVVELVAYTADRLAYYQDAVATEAYLGTARKRISMRRHARLLDYFMHEGANARAWVCLDAAQDGATVRRVNTDGSVTALLTRCVDVPRLPTSQLTPLLQQFSPLVFEPMHDAVLYTAHNTIRFYTWGDDQCCLPRGATRATLADNPANRLRLMAGDVLVFEELRGRDTGLVPDADPTRRQAVRLISVTPSASSSAADDAAATRTPGALATDPLTGQAIVEIEWHADDALTFPLCISTMVNGLPVEDVSGARGNVLLVDHGRTITAEPLQPAQVPAAGRYRPQLSTPEVTHAAPFDFFAAQSASAAATLAQDPHQTIAEVSLVGAETWTVRRDLLRSDQFATDFVVEMTEDGAGVLRFGDGTLGRLPESNLDATYRVGRGALGNAGAEGIAHILTPETDIDGVRNPLLATGGVDPESLEQVRQYAPQAFRTQLRAVTEADYAAAAEAFAGVKKAVARRSWTGSWFTVFVTVDRVGGAALDAKFRAGLEAALEQVRLAGEDLELQDPALAPLDIQLVVCVEPGYRQDQVAQALLQTFSAGALPMGGVGFFYPDNFTFGQPVYLSEIVAAAMKVPGVAFVDPTDPDFRFTQLHVDATAASVKQGFIDIGSLEVARLDNSPAAPENGTFKLKLMGGL